uniref:Pectin acetylesterase n=1 Tax=uncultured organism TaxID=155900 RepID=M1PQE3_9ZZZZ|nr:pectin acetylesterase [uncultured organism]
MINKSIDIWKGIDKFADKEYRPILDTYILKGERKRPTVLVCPGGGYEFTSPREAEPVALQFNEAGYNAFVLYYSVAPEKHPQPLLDVSRSMCIIRNNSEKWNIKKDKIAVCGFSAGGHLAASLGVHWEKSYLDIKGIEIGSNKPNFLILGYPVITAGEFSHQGSIKNLVGKDPELREEMSLEKQVNQETPPTFIWHTCADKAVPVKNSLLFVESLRKNEIPFEFHIFPEGPHGLSLATAETDDGEMGAYPHVARWIKLCKEWLEINFNK